MKIICGLPQALVCYLHCEISSGARSIPGEEDAIFWTQQRTPHPAPGWERERCRVLILSDGGHITLGGEAYQSWARLLYSLFPQLQLCCLQLTPSPSLPPCFRHRAGLAGSTGFVVRAGSEEGNVLVADSEQFFWGTGTLAEMCSKDGHGKRITAPASRKTS